MKTSEHPIRRIRDRLKMSQEAIAKELDVTQATWSKYERGTVELPIEKARALIKLALGNRLLIDLNHVFEDVPLPPVATERPAAQPGPADLPRDPAAGTKVPRRPGRPVVYSGS